MMVELFEKNLFRPERNPINVAVGKVERALVGFHAGIVNVIKWNIISHGIPARDDGALSASQRLEVSFGYFRVKVISGEGMAADHDFDLVFAALQFHRFRAAKGGKTRRAQNQQVAKKNYSSIPH